MKALTMKILIKQTNDAAVIHVVEKITRQSMYVLKEMCKTLTLLLKQ